jgi:biotin-dependent carboxylase-like uncharacterized protein
MSFRVVQADMLALLQDRGRLGYQHLGLTTGGPMDEYAFAWADKLLNHPCPTPQIEVSYGGFAVETMAQTTIALTGADLAATLNGKAIQPWRTYVLNPGDHLAFKYAVSGARSYIAVQGGLQVSKLLNSTATVVREGVGGLYGQGDKLQVGDDILYRATSALSTKTVPSLDIPSYSGALALGVIPCYQYADFDVVNRARFFSSEYRVTDKIDRMGYRLQGAPIQCQRQGLISEGIAYGSIQIPADGQPIILLKDRQTIGGYPKMGTLSALDASALAQRMPGNYLTFYLTDVEQAETNRHLFLRRLSQFA